MVALTDEQLMAKTAEFKKRYQNGESLDQLLEEAFAAVCEADYRVLGMLPYDVQIMGGIALHKGYMTEMNTGEGKTLTATMPLYLNAISGESVILLTANPYLALRDAAEMGKVYRFMGLTIKAGISPNDGEQLTTKQKQEAYAADIVYTTHSALGFDYLFNNLVKRPKDRFLRKLHYCIIDEADSVLLDAATTPLVISGAPRVQSNLFKTADFFVSTLKENEDYEIEEKQVWLTEKGVEKAEKYFRIEHYCLADYYEINRHVTMALRAHYVMEKDKDYVVSDDGKIVLLDSSSGRLMHGMMLRGGQHQAIEMKEHVNLTSDKRSMAFITYQSFFMLFDKISGMSGTISDAAEELAQNYGVKVLVIPPNKPLMRKDYPDKYYLNRESQYYAAITDIIEIHKTGQPVLVVLNSIGGTNLISKLLLSEHIPHSVLNAQNAYWEAMMIKEAGQMNAITVSTSMAGRGTDIKLGEGVAKLGGLAVIGIGRMNNTRNERQARGRAGRQGDPGFSRFYISLEDEIVAENDGERQKELLERNKEIRERKLKKIVDGAQHLAEERAIESRRNAKQYDEVMQKQREIIYRMRDNLLDGQRLTDEDIEALAKEQIREFIKHNRKQLDERLVNRFILDNITYELHSSLMMEEYKNPYAVEEYLMGLVRSSVRRQKEKVKEEKAWEEYVRLAVFDVLDEVWIEHVDYVQQVQKSIAGRNSAQKNLVYEYQQEAAGAFRFMENEVHRRLIRTLLLRNISADMLGGAEFSKP